MSTQFKLLPDRYKLTLYGQSIGMFDERQLMEIVACGQSVIESLSDKHWRLIDAIGTHHGFSREEMTSRRRDRALVTARAHAMVALKKACPKMTTTQIAGYFGQNHTMVTHNQRKVLESPVLEDRQEFETSLSIGLAAVKEAK